MPTPAGAFSVMDYGDSVKAGYVVGSGGNDAKAFEACRKAAVATPSISAANSVSGDAKMGHMWCPTPPSGHYNIGMWKPAGGNFQMEVEADAEFWPITGTGGADQMIYLDAGSTPATALRNIRIFGSGNFPSGAHKPAAPRFGWDISQYFVVILDATVHGKSSNCWWMNAQNLNYCEMYNIVFRMNQSTVANGPASSTSCITPNANRATTPDSTKGPTGVYTCPQNCDWHHMYMYNGPQSYGLFEVDCIQNSTFRDTVVVGGKNVRLESGKPSAGYIDNLNVNNVYGADGCDVITLSPAGQWNGHVYADGMYGDSMEDVVKIIDNRNTGLGKFEHSTFKNVYGRAGHKAQTAAPGDLAWEFNVGQQSETVVNKSGPWQANMEFIGKVHGDETINKFRSSPISDAPYDNAAFTYPGIPAGIPQPTINTNPTDGTTSTSANFTYSVASGSYQFEVSIDGAAFVDDDTATAGSSGAKAYTGLAVGDHTFVVQAYNPSTGQRGIPRTFGWTVAPLVGGIPAATTISSGPTDAGTDTDVTPTFAWGAASGATSYSVNVDSTGWVNIGAVLTYTLPTSSYASHTFAVRGVNATGSGPKDTRAWTIIPSGTTGLIPGRVMGNITLHDGQRVTSGTDQLVCPTPVLQKDWIALACVRARGLATTVTVPPPGYIKLGESRQMTTTPHIGMMFYYRLCDGTESDPFTLFQLDTTGVGVSLDIIPIEGIDEASLIDAFAINDSGGVQGTTATCPSANVPEVGSLVMLYEAFSSQTTVTPNAGVTEHYDYQANDAVSRITCHLSVVSATSVGASGAYAEVAGGLGQWASATIVLSPTVQQVIGAQVQPIFREKRLAVRTGTFLDHYCGTVRQMAGDGAIVCTDLSASQQPDGTYTFDPTRYDAMATALAKYNLVWLPCLKMVDPNGVVVTPRRSTVGNPDVVSGRMLKFKDFCMEMYRRYGLGGSFTAPGWTPVVRWHIWSDIDTDTGSAFPNKAGDLTAPANYYELVARGAAALRAAAGGVNIEIVGPGMNGLDPVKLAPIIDYWKSTSQQSLFTQVTGWSTIIDSKLPPRQGGALYQSTSPYYVGTYDPQSYASISWLRSVLNAEGGATADIYIIGGGYAGDDAINSYVDPLTLLGGQLVMWESANTPGAGGHTHVYTEPDQNGYMNATIDWIAGTAAWNVRSFGWSQLFDSDPPLAVAGDVATYVAQKRGLVNYNDAVDAGAPAGTVDPANWKVAGLGLQSRIVNVPNSPPSLDILSPVGGTMTTGSPFANQATIEARALIVDPEGAGIVTATVATGSNPPQALSQVGSTDEFSRFLAVDGAPDPGNTVRVTFSATDANGKTSSDFRDITVVIPTVGASPPDVQIQAPVDGSTTTVSSQLVTAAITAPTGVGRVWCDVGGTQTDLLLLAGETNLYGAAVEWPFVAGTPAPVTFTVYATEASPLALQGSDTATITVAVPVASPPPQTRPAYPTDGATISDLSPILRYEAESAAGMAGVTAAVNGAPPIDMFFDGVFWTLHSPPLIPGNNTITYVATARDTQFTTDVISFAEVVAPVVGDSGVIVMEPDEGDGLWRVAVYDVHSGEKITEVHPKQLRFGMYISGTGYINFDVPVDNDHSQQFHAKSQDWLLSYSGQPIMAGNVESVVRDKDARAVSVVGYDWQQQLENVYLYFDVNNPVNFYQVQVDQFTAIERYLDAVLRDGYLNLSYNNGTSGNLTTMHVLAADLTPASQVINDQATLKTGFDYFITWDKRFVMFAPHRDEDANYTMADHKNIKSMHYENQGILATEMYGTGSGTSTSKLMAYRREPLLELSVRRRTVVEDFGQLIDSKALSNATDDEFNRQTHDVVESWFTIKPQPGDNFWGSNNVGKMYRSQVEVGGIRIDNEWHAVSIEGYTTDDGNMEAVVTVNDHRFLA